jgi:hypothetical protein
MGILRRGSEAGAPEPSRSAAHPREWPPEGTHVILVLGKYKTGYRSEVVLHDRSRELFELAEPHIPGETILADSGDLITVTWTSPGGVHALRTRLVEVPVKPPVWRVEPTSPVALVNRRRHPRAPWRARARLILASGEEYEVSLIDVSEGGFRVISPKPVKAGAGAPVVTRIPIEGGDPVEANGSVAWHRMHGQQTELGLTIQDVTRRDIARIRDLVHRVLRNGR